MIAIIDYGVGNLFSLKSSITWLGMEAVVTKREEDLRAADKIILPGVGAFADAIEKLKKTGLVRTLKEEAAGGKPILGICLGMQLLFDKSFEYGVHEGLGLIGGEICSIEADLPVKTAGGDAQKLKVPHIGWNSLHIERDDPVFRYSKEGDHMYYVHSFYAKNCAKATLATSGYEIRIPGVVRCRNVYGMQFHPEKSGEAGLRLLRAFEEIRGS